MIFQKELNPFVEIMGLIFFINHKEEAEKEMMEELAHMGIEGQAFYNSNFGVITKYTEDYKKKHIRHPDEEFLFGNYDLSFLNLAVASLLEHPEWLADTKQITKEAVLTSFSNTLSEELKGDGSFLKLDTLEAQINFLNEQELSDSIKWKLMVTLQDPVHWVSSITEIYTANIPAFEYAVSQNKREIDALIEEVSDTSQMDNTFIAAMAAFPEVQNVYPVVITPLSAIVSVNCGFYGVFVNRLFQFENRMEQEKSILLTSLKILGDKSKFEILCSLKQKPRYNLELAEALHLTTATTSHHMNMLLTNGFVAIEKKDAKVYYNFCPKKIEEIIQLLQKHFLY